MEHDIPIRKMAFGFPEEINPVIRRGFPEESFFYLGLSAILPYLEPYLIRTMKAAAEGIDDPSLREQATRFMSQEGQHYQQHIKFNRACGLNDVPEVRALEEGIGRAFDHYTKTKSLRFNLAYAEAFEAATTAVALGGFATRVFDEMDSFSSNIWQWHLVEELEHRTVAFDVYDHLCGGYWYRLGIGLFAQLGQG